MSPESQMSLDRVPVIFGCGGQELTRQERDLFCVVKPLGLILFQRNCGSAGQIRRLVADFKEVLEGYPVLVLIDQEGGRVARLGPPEWRSYPAAKSIGNLAMNAPGAGVRAAYLIGRLIGHDLHELGINVDCAPVLDVPQPDSDPVIGDRAFADDPDLVARLGQAMCDGLMDSGVFPVIKHIPGHGRASVDSHHALPHVMAGAAALRACDFVPFQALCTMPFAMTAHILYQALDPSCPATQSAQIIAGVIRTEIGFSGVLISDDLAMDALAGTLEERARKTVGAGCDVVLHCNGRLDEMRDVAVGAGALTAQAAARLEAALRRAAPPKPGDFEVLRAEFDGLMGPV